MFARVMTLQPRPDLVDEAITNFREQVLPTAKGQKGFKGTLLLVDRKAGRTLGITLWESEADMRASEDTARLTQAHPADDLGMNPGQLVEHFEIAEQA